MALKEMIYQRNGSHMHEEVEGHAVYCRRLETLTEGVKRRSTVEIARDGTLILIVYRPVSGLFDVVTYLPDEAVVCDTCGRQAEDGGDHADTYGHYPS